MQEQVHSKEHQLCEVEAPVFADEAVRNGAESNVRLLSVSEPDLMLKSSS